MLAIITKTVPIIKRIPSGSPKTIKPIITLVASSIVLKIEASSPPIIRVLCWNNTIAPIVTSKENIMDSASPKNEDGKVSELEAKQKIKVNKLTIVTT